MDQQEATKALEFLRRVVNQAQDDTALQNWGVIWIVHSFTNGAGFIATTLLMRNGVSSPLVYQGMWATILTFNLVLIFALKTRRTGVKSFVETQVWAIWMNFIGAVILVAAINHLMGLKLFFLGPVIGVLCATSFVSMAMIAGRRYFAAAGAMAVAALIMSVLPEWQFLILGVAWLVVQLPLGVFLHLERKRQSTEVKIV